MQALLTSRRIQSENVSSYGILGRHSVRLSDAVKNFGRLSWRNQVSYVVSCKFCTFRLFYRFQRYTSRLRWYTAVVYFPTLTGTDFRRLELAFNACTRYVFDLRGIDHISEFSRVIWGCRLFEYLELWLAGFFQKKVIIGANYSRLVLGRSPRLRFLVIPNPVPVTSLRGDALPW
jgi:hypothetical protein